MSTHGADVRNRVGKNNSAKRFRIIDYGRENIEREYAEKIIGEFVDGGIIGGLGPALSDLISGYPQWAIFTFIIDGLQAVLVGLLVREFKPANVVIGSLVAGVWKVFGYFIAGGLMYGNYVVAALSIPMNLIQFVVGFLIAAAIWPGVKRLRVE